jgi:glutamyl-tRNA reductase
MLNVMGGASAVSVAYAAVQLAKRIFSDLSQTTVLFIGAGETIALCAQHLANQGVTQMIVANRTVARAQELALQYGGEAIALFELPHHLARADIVISSTASQLPLLGKGAVERAIKQRKHKLMFMVDLAVPRDIEPEVAELDDVFLYSVDDLNGVVQENLKARQEAAVQAEEIIAGQVDQFLAWQRSRDAAGTIRDLRSRFQSVQEDEAQRAIARLRAGENAEDVVKQLAHRLGNKFLHAPSEHLRNAAADGQQETLNTVRRVFDLDN